MHPIERIGLHLNIQLLRRSTRARSEETARAANRRAQLDRIEKHGPIPLAKARCLSNQHSPVTHSLAALLSCEKERVVDDDDLPVQTDKDTRFA